MNIQKVIKTQNIVNHQESKFIELYKFKNYEFDHKLLFYSSNYDKSIYKKKKNIDLKSPIALPTTTSKVIISVDFKKFADKPRNKKKFK